MVALRYIYLLCWKLFYSFSALTRQIFFNVTALEEKCSISARRCNVLYYFYQFEKSATKSNYREWWSPGYNIFRDAI